MTEPFYIEFSGPKQRFLVLEGLFNRIRDVKDGSPRLEWNERAALIDDPAWVDLLDTELIERLTSTGWPLEDILDCMLAGEYDLLCVTFRDKTGRLEYDPHSYPFGGTDPLKALVESCGFIVTHDSLYDDGP